MRVLVFRIGQLGDTLVAVPALRVVRTQFPGAHVTLLCDASVGPKSVTPASVLQGTGLIDESIIYQPVRRDRGNNLGQFAEVLRLWRKIAFGGFDLLVYLPPSARSPLRILRDRILFFSTGIPRSIGFKASRHATIDADPAEADWILARLERDGLPIPAAGKGDASLPVSESELRQFSAWSAAAGFDSQARWIAVGAGTKMPAKQWPAERYAEVLKSLNLRYGLRPLILGSPDERAVGNQILQTVGTGLNACGELSVKGSLAALERCVLYLGNDTGTMHLAAAVKRPCVAVFSFRVTRTSWYPYGVPSRVLRHDVPCKGCGLSVCTENANRCLAGIGTGEVLAACEDLLRGQGITAHP